MSKTKTLISKDNGHLQIPYKEYEELMDKVREGQNLRQLRNQVVANLQKFLGGVVPVETASVEVAEEVAVEEKPIELETKKVSMELDATEQAAPSEEEAPVQEEAPAPVQVPPAKPRNLAQDDVPPIKQDIANHINKLDESGRLFSVFQQYYTCLNDACGGTVRVTMKDGFCSLWNYDEWEEFAFVDVFEGQLRVAVDPRYAGELGEFNSCEVPRLLSSRRELACFQVGDLNNKMLGVLVKAFSEIGMTLS